MSPYKDLKDQKLTIQLKLLYWNVIRIIKLITAFLKSSLEYELGWYMYMTNNSWETLWASQDLIMWSNLGEKLKFWQATIIQKGYF